MEFLTITLLNGLSHGLLLFMLSAGLTLVFSLMGVLNFAHASFYMLGAYLGYSLAGAIGFWAALPLAPLAVGLVGAAFETLVLRRVRRAGHVAELLVTVGLATVVLEVVQLVWGRAALDFQPPALLRGPLLTLIDSSRDGLSWQWGSAPTSLCGAAQAAQRVVCSPFPATRAFVMVVALAMLAALCLLLARTRIGLVIRAALTHPRMVEALGHDVPRVFATVFGLGTALAGLAGVVGGSTFVTEPAMAAALGPVIFVVVIVGGLGSLPGAFVASLLIGLGQTLLVAFDGSLGTALAGMGVPSAAGAALSPALSHLTPARLAPVLPYAVLVLVLVFRPQGLFGRRGP